jgi:hypothetical protein
VGRTIVGRPVISGIERLQLCKTQRGNGALSFGDAIYLPIVKNDQDTVSTWAHVQFQGIHAEADSTLIAVDRVFWPQAPASPMGDRLW